MGNERAPERVLVVDDEESIREVVSTLLRSAGYKCSQAGSGVEALALLDSGEEFELMLSDLMMAELDGIGLLERTKEQLSRHAGRYGDGRSRYFGRAGCHSQRCVRLPSANLSKENNCWPPSRRALENRRLKLENGAYQTNLEALVAARTQNGRPFRSGTFLRHHLTKP